MLKLDKIEIAGFKSFTDRTEVQLPGGITAIVGPNGCGKSNLGDALNWALGEQSPKMLRGKQMADIIFAGSRTRKPVGMAEVSLHLSGAEGLTGSDQGRVVVTRRLFRSGDSEYALNGARARLKDIQELLREAHVGTKTYATIEQGKIDQVLNAKPYERRLIIEDAAGIVGYKHKRRLTELKLEATDANLLRVNDIIVEVRRQINSLKRQAAKARRYRRLREELRDKEKIRFALRGRDTDRELEKIRATETRVQDDESASAASLGRLEVELLDERAAIERAAEELRATAERLHQFEIEIDRLEGQIRGSTERNAESQEVARRQRVEAEELGGKLSEVETRAAGHRERLEAVKSEVDRLATELEGHQTELARHDDDVRNRRQKLESLRGEQFQAVQQAADSANALRRVEEALERGGQLQARLDREWAEARDDCSRIDREAASLSAETEEQGRRLEDLETQFAEAEVALSQTRQRHDAQLEALVSAREQEKSGAARLATLEDVATRFAGVSDGVRTLLTSGSAAGVHTHGVVADYIEAETHVEGAAEGYFNWLLPTVILEDDDDVQRAAELLRTEGAGRTSFISRSQPAGRPAVGMPQNGQLRIPAEILEDGRVLGRLRDSMTLKTSANGAVGERIGDAILVESLAAALELHRNYPTADYLTPEGDVVYASGVIVVGAKTKTSRNGLLAHNRHIQEAREEFVTASGACRGFQEEVDDLREQVIRLEVEAREGRQALDDERRSRLELEHRSTRSSEDRERSGRRSRVLDQELAAAREEAERLAAERREAVAAQAVAEEARRSLELALTSTIDGLSAMEDALRAATDRVSAAHAALAVEQQRYAAQMEEESRLKEAAQELRTRIGRLTDEARAADARAEESAHQGREAEGCLAERIQERERLASSTARTEHELGDRRADLSRREESLRTARSSLESLREKTREAQVERARAEASRQHLEELCSQELGVPVDQVLAEVADQLEDADLEQLEPQVDELRQKIERLGPVNMTAIEEFSDLEERDAFLTAQREDLQHAMESLRETIRRINRQSRERFTSAFEAIRASYQEIFKSLFQGGRADLRLEEGDDVLECGIEIMAQPPGKRLTNVQLLSGGEKSMSAIALLFAVFRYQPSPFCLLDEVDAALDDANVVRFAKMVREYASQTQFILITHNKLSMEAADLLYGVTMEEPGVTRLVSIELQ